MKTLVTFVCAVGVLFASGCASLGPKLADVQKDVPALHNGEARLYLYRTSSLFVGGGLQPDIKLNGKPIGSAVTNTVRFIDLQPGTYKVACTTEKTNELEVTLASGETKYVRLVPYMGVLIDHIDPQIVPNSEGEDAIHDLTLVMPPQMKNRVPASLYKAP